MRPSTARALLLGVIVVVAADAGAQTLTGELTTITVARGDTLRKLGSRFGVDPATIAADNGLSADAAIGVGIALRIDNRHITPAFAPGVSIVVNVPQRILFALTGTGVVAYPVAVGRRDWQTPLGAFAIVTKETNPTWDVPESIRQEARRAGRSLPLTVAPGPDNPLGAYWLGLSLDSVGIHGTNAPGSIYQTVTHGCIRLHPDDVEALFQHVQVGSKGELIYQPLLIALRGTEVFLEVHRDAYRRGPDDALAFVKTQARGLGVFDRIDWEAVERVIAARAGVARVVTAR